MEKIVLDKFSVGGKCNLFHHGTVQDCLQSNHFEFYKGKLYGIIGEFGFGGAALSCGMTGNTDFYDGKIFIDDVECTIKDIIKNSWYVGFDLNESKGLFSKKKTIREQIEKGILNINKELDLKMLQDIFNISNERLDREINFVSGERWKASVAIGYANGRKIFCYPWMNSWDIEFFKEQITNAIRYLLDSNCIVILPTTREENVRKVFHKYCLVQL